MMIIPETDNRKSSFEEINHVFKKLKLEKKPNFNLSNYIKGLSCKNSNLSSKTQIEEELVNIFPFLNESEVKSILTDVDYNLEEAKNLVFNREVKEGSGIKPELRVINTISKSNLKQNLNSDLNTRSKFLSSKRFCSNRERENQPEDSTKANNSSTEIGITEQIKLAGIKLSGIPKEKFDSEFRSILTPIIKRKFII
jgi:hypothetical protein